MKAKAISTDPCEDPRHGPRGYIQHSVWGDYHVRRGHDFIRCEICDLYRLDCDLDPRQYDYVDDYEDHE